MSPHCSSAPDTPPEIAWQSREPTNHLRRGHELPWGFSWNVQIDEYPLVNVHITDGKITFFNGKTHYKWPFSIAMLVYQRVF